MLLTEYINPKHYLHPDNLVPDAYQHCRDNESVLDLARAMIITLRANKEHADALLRYGNQKYIYNNTIHDNFFGICTCMDCYKKQGLNLYNEVIHIARNTLISDVRAGRLEFDYKIEGVPKLMKGSHVTWIVPEEHRYKGEAFAHGTVDLLPKDGSDRVTVTYRGMVYTMPIREVFLEPIDMLLKPYYAGDN